MYSRNRDAYLCIEQSTFMLNLDEVSSESFFEFFEGLIQWIRTNGGIYITLKLE